MPSKTGPYSAAWRRYGNTRGHMELLVQFGWLPKVEWPMPKQDALDILITSLVHRKLDAVRRLHGGG